MNSSQRVVKIRISPGTVEDSAAILHTIANLFQTEDLEISILDKESLMGGAGVHIAGHDMSVVVNVSNQGFSEKDERFEILPSQNSLKNEHDPNRRRAILEAIKASGVEVLQNSLNFSDAHANIFSQAEKNLNRRKEA